ncbi:uncharacterized protein LOC143299734 [Babylonia areolata]|uniref:uncharacterized protein LOC143299734 n=1 Tax=Babylonia areolata TaxID=304850 RepID=UPI003FD613FB
MNVLLCTVLLVVTFCVGVSKGACGPQSPNLITYVPINETLYDRNYSRIDSGRHPLGFYTDTWHYNQGVPNPCISISAENARASYLEIKVETDPTSRLCVKDQDSARECFEGTVALCWETPGDTTYVEFLCDSQCGEADVTFWYRLVLSPPDYEDWCFTRDSLFPADLVSAPSGADLPTYTTPKPRGGTGSAPRGPSSSYSSSSPLLLAAAAMVIYSARFS